MRISLQHNPNFSTTAQDSHALTVGADVVSQSFLISVALALVCLEYWRGNNAKIAETIQKKEEKAARKVIKDARLADIDQRIAELGARLDALEASEEARKQSTALRLLRSITSATPPSTGTEADTAQAEISWAHYFSSWGYWARNWAWPTAKDQAAMQTERVPTLAAPDTDNGEASIKDLSPGSCNISSTSVIHASSEGALEADNDTMAVGSSVSPISLTQATIHDSVLSGSEYPSYNIPSSAQTTHSPQ